MIPRKPLTPEKRAKLIQQKRASVERQLAKKRAKPPTPRKPMRKMSRAKQTWTAKYHRELRLRKQEQRNERGTTYCVRCNAQGPVDGHHIAGRVGINILRFVLLDRACHDFVHQNSKLARQEGWLL